MRRSFKLWGMILMWCCMFPVVVKAEDKIISYTLDTDSLTKTQIADNISSLSLIRNTDGFWDLYVNNNLAATAADDQKLNFDFNVNASNFNLEVDIAKLSANIMMSISNDILLASKLVFTNYNDQQMLYFYPGIDKDEAIIREGDKNNNNIYFAPITYDFFYEIEGTIKTKKLTLDVSIDTLTNHVILIKNGVREEKAIDLLAKAQTIFLDTLVPAHTIDVDYLVKNLSLRNFAAASDQPYATTDINDLAANEKIVLRHESSNRTLTVSLRQFIDYWERLPDGTYNTAASTRKQVVCQWDEEACSGIRSLYGDQGRLYAVFGGTYHYSDVETYQDITNEPVVVDIYKNIIWPEELWKTTSLPVTDDLVINQMKVNTGNWGSWSEYTTIDDIENCSDNLNCEYKTKIKYRKRLASWGNWGSYGADYPADCEDSVDCRWESQSFYSKRTATWNSYSDFNAQYPADCNDNVDCTWISKKYYRKRSYYYSGSYSSWKSSCSVNDDHHCAAYYKYTCKLGSKIQTRYSTSYYSLNSHGPCGSGYKISSRNSGYRYRYIKWSAWSNYDTNSCSNISGYQKCETQTRYATRYRHWGSWSAYNQTTCKTDNNTQCRGPVKYYRTQKRTWQPWSDYIYDSCSSSNDIKCASIKYYAYKYRTWTGWSEWQALDKTVNPDGDHKVLYRYNSGKISWDEFKGDSTVIGSGTYWLGEVKQADMGNHEVEETYVRKVDRQLETHQKMTVADIMGLADKIGEAAIASHIYDDLLLANGKVRWNDLETADRRTYLFYGSQKRYDFLNSELFIPYIYVREHYRAAQQTIDVYGYDDAISIFNTIEIDKTLSETAKLIPIYDETGKESRVIFYDFHDPLTNYEQLPQIWADKLILLEEIKNADLNNADLCIKLDQDDIKKIREYLIGGGYKKIGTCDILREFAYLFDDNEGALNLWLQETESGCLNVGSH